MRAIEMLYLAMNITGIDKGTGAAITVRQDFPLTYIQSTAMSTITLKAVLSKLHDQWTTAPNILQIWHGTITQEYT